MEHTPPLQYNNSYFNIEYRDEVFHGNQFITSF